MSAINANAVTGKVMGMMTEAAGDSERVDKSIDDTLGGGVKAAGGKAAKEAVKKIEDMVAEQKSVKAEEAQQPDNGKKTKQETEKPAEKPEKKNKAKKDRDIKETGEKQKSRNLKKALKRFTVLAVIISMALELLKIKRKRSNIGRRRRKKDM